VARRNRRARAALGGAGAGLQAAEDSAIAADEAAINGAGNLFVDASGAAAAMGGGLALREGQMLHFVLPGTLPQQLSTGAAAKARAAATAAAAAAAAASAMLPGGAEEADDALADPSEPFRERARSIPEGRAGQLRVFDSGRVELIMHGLPFDVTAGVARSMCEQVVALLPADKADRREEKARAEAERLRRMRTLQQRGFSVAEDDEDDGDVEEVDADSDEGNAPVKAEDGEGADGAAGLAEGDRAARRQRERAQRRKARAALKPSHFVVLDRVGHTVYATPSLERMLETQDAAHWQKFGRSYREIAEIMGMRYPREDEEAEAEAEAGGAARRRRQQQLQQQARGGAVDVDGDVKMEEAGGGRGGGRKKRSNTEGSLSQAAGDLH
jgi:hypothetical protein